MEWPNNMSCFFLNRNLKIIHLVLKPIFDRWAGTRLLDEGSKANSRKELV